MALKIKMKGGNDRLPPWVSLGLVVVGIFLIMALKYFWR